jgi:hypothetical protein
MYSPAQVWYYPAPDHGAGYLTLQYAEETRDPVLASRHAVNILLPMVAGLIVVPLQMKSSSRTHTNTLRFR